MVNGGHQLHGRGQDAKTAARCRDGRWKSVDGGAAISGGVLEEGAAQPLHGLAMELALARLGDREDVGDVAHGQLIDLIEGDHEPFTVGEALDGLDKVLVELPLVEAAGKVDVVVRRRHFSRRE